MDKRFFAPGQVYGLNGMGHGGVDFGLGGVVRNAQLGRKGQALLDC